MLFTLFLFIYFVAGAQMNVHLSDANLAKPVACSFFGHDNAAKLLGQKATGIDGEESKADGAIKWTCTFTTEAGENGPKIYFAIFKDVSEEAAKSEFQKVRHSNQKNAGFEEWHGIADEAVIHSDGKNFQFVMVRKGTRTFRIKIGNSNGISLDDLKTVAASLAAKMK